MLRRDCQRLAEVLRILERMIGPDATPENVERFGAASALIRVVLDHNREQRERPKRARAAVATRFIRLARELAAERAARLEAERTLELSAVGVALSVATRRRVDA